jgi:hypothetical protein
MDGAVVGCWDGKAENIFVGLDENFSDGRNDGKELGTSDGETERGKVSRDSSSGVLLVEDNSVPEGDAVGFVDGLAEGAADDASLASVCSKNARIKSMYPWSTSTATCYRACYRAISHHYR